MSGEAKGELIGWLDEWECVSHSCGCGGRAYVSCVCGFMFAVWLAECVGDDAGGRCGPCGL